MIFTNRVLGTTYVLYSSVPPSRRGPVWLADPPIYERDRPFSAEWSQIARRWCSGNIRNCAGSGYEPRDDKRLPNGGVYGFIRDLENRRSGDFVDLFG